LRNNYTLKTVAIKAVSWWVLALGLLAPAQATDLTAYTEEWAPYNYSEQGAIKGIATDMLREACAMVKISCDIRMVPWARAVRVVGNTPNTLMFTTARKPSREGEYLWVGPILPRATWVYTKAGKDKGVRSAQDLAHLRIGVVREEAARQDLLDAGVPATSLVDEVSNAEVLRMLMGSRVDAMVDTEVGMEWNLRNASIAASTVTRLVKLSDGGAYYYALNLQTDPALARALQDALDKLRRTGRLQAIVTKYTGTK
jgi:polar amino acid transport system substrate-binding protein